MNSADRGLEGGCSCRPGRLPPDMHIFTSTRQPWVALPARIPAVPECYRASEHWPAASLERRARLQAQAQQQQ